MFNEIMLWLNISTENWNTHTKIIYLKRNKIEILELKLLTIKTKNSVDEFNHWLDTAKKNPLTGEVDQRHYAE